MRILINHLTRMQSGFICTAGIDLATHRHVRPVVRGAGLRSDLLATNGGPLALAAVVDLGPTKYVGQVPETEDYLFDARKALLIRHATMDEFWSCLARSAKPTLAEVFGEELTPRGPSSCGTDLGKGKVSLGCLLLNGRPVLSLCSRPGKPDQPRMRLCDGRFELDLGVTDIRLSGPDHHTPDRDVIQRVAQRLRDGSELILSVGLTRPFSGTAGLPPVHWLQVNNLHFHDNLVW
jgi:hypothetical protein